jgi:hypothetical protein
MQKFMCQFVRKRGEFFRWRLARKQSDLSAAGHAARRRNFH